MFFSTLTPKEKGSLIEVSSELERVTLNFFFLWLICYFHERNIWFPGPFLSIEIMNSFNRDIVQFTHGAWDTQLHCYIPFLTNTLFIIRDAIHFVSGEYDRMNVSRTCASPSNETNPISHLNESTRGTSKLTQGPMWGSSFISFSLIFKSCRSSF